MTQDNFVEYVWRGLSVRKHAIGRRGVSRIVARALKTWPTGVMELCDERQAGVLAKHFASSLKRNVRQQEYGMGFIAMILLSSLISEIVKRMFAHWFASAKNQAEMRLMSEAAK